MAAASLPLTLAGETMQAFADRALFWPSQSLLMIADLHLGKGEALRRGGIAVPRGGTQDDLGRLHVLLERTAASELCVLGDFLHGASEGGAWEDEWQAWRAAHARLAISVVTGNHDRRLRRRAADWGIVLHEEGRARDPFELRHVPRTTGVHVIAGHVHPRLRYPGLPGRWPVFLLRPGLTILPAFSRFTGGAHVDLAADDYCLVCLDGLIARLPPDA